MSQQQKLWVALVKATISELFKYGKGSRQLKQKISEILEIESEEN